MGRTEAGKIAGMKSKRNKWLRVQVPQKRARTGLGYLPTPSPDQSPYKQPAMRARARHQAHGAVVDAQPARCDCLRSWSAPPFRPSVAPFAQSPSRVSSLKLLEKRRAPRVPYGQASGGQRGPLQGSILFHPRLGPMGPSNSYNRERATRAREAARRASLIEHRQHYFRLAFQYDAIAGLEAKRPRLRPFRPTAQVPPGREIGGLQTRGRGEDLPLAP